MENTSLIHDTTWKMTHNILNIFRSLLREEEQLDAFSEINDVVKKGLEEYEARAARMAKRLHPEGK